VGGEHFGFAAIEEEAGGTVVDMNPKPRGGGNGKRKDVITSSVSMGFISLHLDISGL
jgi:hypothetical protein